VNDIDAIDFFRDDAMVVDPFPYFDGLREQCPVRREPHHDVVMITGYDEAIEVYNDTETFSSCTSVSGPFPGFPVPLEGDDLTELIEAHRDELPFSDQITTQDPPVHTDQRALLMRLLTPKRLKEGGWRIPGRKPSSRADVGRPSTAQRARRCRIGPNGASAELRHRIQARRSQLLGLWVLFARAGVRRRAGCGVVGGGGARGR
jgi:hypothetical protein